MSHYNNAKRAINRVFRKFWNVCTGKSNVKKLYEESDFLEAYRKHSDMRVEVDPHSAVGGRWEEMGKLQFEFFLKKKLRPDHRLLDIGCGTLRGGRHFIRYLDTGKYTGIDLSCKAIEFARQLVEEEGLSERKPILIVSENKNLKFCEFENQHFDFLLAQSVFTHLMPEHIEECLKYVGTAMKDDSAFYFTFFKAIRYEQTGLKDFSYPVHFFQDLAAKFNFDLLDCSSEYSHPRGQQMLCLTKR